MYVIKAALFKIRTPFYRKFAHNFWVLIDDDHQKIIAELHGLATSRNTGIIAPIGYKKEHTLRAHHLVRDKEFAQLYNFNLSSFTLDYDEMATIFSGDDSLKRWLKAVKFITTINQLDLNYPRFGVTLPVTATINSNSVYHTLANIMGIEVYNFPGYIQIGLNNTLITNFNKECY